MVGLGIVAVGMSSGTGAGVSAVAVATVATVATVAVSAAIAFVVSAVAAPVVVVVTAACGGCAGPRVIATTMDAASTSTPSNARARLRAPTPLPARTLVIIKSASGARSRVEGRVGACLAARSSELTAGASAGGSVWATTTGGAGAAVGKRFGGACACEA